MVNGIHGILENMTTHPTLYIGMPVTYTVGSDSYPGLITFVNPRARKFTFVKLDTTGVENGHIYTERELVLLRNPRKDEQQSMTIASLRKDNVWRIMKSQIPVSPGQARFYRDPSF